MARSPRFSQPSIEVERRPDGALVLRSREALADHPAHLGLVLRGWADAVIAGHGRESVGVLLFPDAVACARAIDAPADTPRSELLRDERLRSRIADALRIYNHDQGEASSRAVVSAILLEEPPSIDAGEITDKGYINQRAVLDRRSALVDALFAPDGRDAIRVR